MAITQNTYTGNGSTTNYSFTFEYLETTDIKVSVNGVNTTAYTLANATTVSLNTAPANGASIRIYRQTDDSSLSSTFAAGSAIRANDLNNNFTQTLYVAQEVNNNALDIDGSNPLAANLNLGGFQINNLAAPTAGTDATNRTYVDTVVSNGIADGDKGDITVTGNGSTLTIDNGVITSAKIADGAIVDVDVNASAAIASSKLAFTQAGTGASARTVDGKLKDVVSVKDFGAVGDGIADDTAAIQAALTYINSVGGGVVYLPPGTYRKADTSATLIMYSNTTLRGEGDCSVIFHEDLPTNPRCDLLTANNTSNISFDSFKITGTVATYTVETNQSQTLTGIGIDGLRMSNVTIQGVRYTATAFSYVRRAVVQGCRFIDVLRDGCRFTASQDISIIGNNFRRVADDAVALHSLDTDSTVPLPTGVASWASAGLQSGLIVTGNTFEASQGVKVLGAKIATVSGNTFRRMMRLPITVDSTKNLPEGNTPMFCINIVDNVITDTLHQFNTTTDGGHAIKVNVRTRSKGALSTQPGFVSDVAPYNWTNNIDGAGAINIGSWGVKITGNTVATTLPVAGVTNYSDYGYGTLLDRQGGSFGPGFYDPAITSTFFGVGAIYFEGPARGLAIESNTLSGGTINTIAVQVENNNANDGINRESAVIRNNTITDWPGTGISLGDASCSYLISGNWFDLDPHFRHPDHSSSTNKWSSISSVSCVNTASGNFGMAHGNVFAHAARITGNVNGFTWDSNYVIFDPNGTLGLDGPADVRGLRVVPGSLNMVPIIYNGDPASASFKQITTIPRLHAAAMPSSGTYVYGHVVYNKAVVLSGSPQYSLLGWQRITTGTAHVLNTDWKELRCLTGA